MKILFCKECQDCIKLVPQRESRCMCGKSHGTVKPDGLNAIISGENAIAIGFSNQSLRIAVIKQPIEGLGKDFVAFVIPKQCPTVKYLSCE